jgi:hypothetical protein
VARAVLLQAGLMDAREETACWAKRSKHGGVAGGWALQEIERSYCSDENQARVLACCVEMDGFELRRCAVRRCGGARAWDARGARRLGVDPWVRENCGGSAARACWRRGSGGAQEQGASGASCS